MTIKNQIEALLFSSGKAMEEEQLADIVSAERKQVKQALKRLQKDYDERDCALKIFNEGSTWKMIVREEYISLVRRIVADTELSRATLETLAVIAYNHPKVLQSKVIDIRGSNAYDHIKELVELGFVTKEKEGRSFALKLAAKFFDYFDVEHKDLKKALDVIIPPEKEEQQKLGSLDVVEVPPEEEKQEGLEETEDELPPLEGEKIERDVEGEKTWLEKLDNQIDEIAKKNDDTDKDELLKRKEENDDSEEEKKE